MNRKTKLFWLWAAGLICALCPIFFDAIHRWFEPEGLPWVSLIIHGELVIISVAIIADTLVGAAKSDDTKALRYPVMLGCALALLLMVFAAGELRGKVAAKKDAAFTDSIILSRVHTCSTIAFSIAVCLSLTAAMKLED